MTTTTTTTVALDIVPHDLVALVDAAKTHKLTIDLLAEVVEDMDERQRLLEKGISLGRALAALESAQS